MKYSKIESVNFINTVRELEKALKELEGLRIGDCDDSAFTNAIDREKDDILKELHQLYKNKGKGAMVRARCKILSDREEPNSSFFNLEIKNGWKQKIGCLKTGQYSFTQSTEDNIEAATRFYEDLYKFEDSDDAMADLFTSNLPQIPEDCYE